MPDTQIGESSTYVMNLLRELQAEFDGLHQKMNELELLRHYEDPIRLAAEEKASGLEIRIGATAELIENIKASLTANIPKVIMKALRSGDDADKNTSQREQFWTNFINWISSPEPVLAELVDAQAGLGLGILKGSYFPWPKAERKRLKSEHRTRDGDRAFRARLKALKRKWGPPFRIITIHPLTFYFRLGPGNEIVESIEHSWKSKREMFDAYGMTDAKLRAESDLLNIGDTGITEATQTKLSSIEGQPEQTIRPFPAGVSAETMVLVTEYRSDNLYQVYIDGRLVDNCVGDPPVKYFLCTGRTTSSKDPDKFGLSVAEAFRHNEPIINRALTRLAEATELLVRKRLTIESPEDATVPTEVDIPSGESNQPTEARLKTYTFKGDKAESLPAGAKVVDPFAGVENVYQAMPFIQLMMSIMGQHGVSPIFKGVPPSASSSGFDDNSLFLMAKSQFQYLLDSYANCVGAAIEWMEGQLVTRVQQEIWVQDLHLSPKDVEEFPAISQVTVEPLLPQNLIAEGQFWDRMEARGHITQRTVLERGLRFDQPETELRNRLLQDLQELMKPVLFQDVLTRVGVLPKPGEQPQQGLVDPTGKPIGGTPGGNGGGGDAAQAVITEMLQSMGGRTRQGQPRQPPETAGSTAGLEQPL